MTDDVLRERLAAVELKLNERRARRSAVTGGLGIIRAPIDDDVQWLCQTVRSLLERLAAAERAAQDNRAWGEAAIADLKTAQQRVVELERLNQSYYDEAADGWAKFREAERQLGAVCQHLADFGKLAEHYKRSKQRIADLEAGLRDLHARASHRLDWWLEQPKSERERPVAGACEITLTNIQELTAALLAQGQTEGTDG